MRIKAASKLLGDSRVLCDRFLKDYQATIYGVGAANLLFLPAAGKLRIRLREEQAQREMVLEGVISIIGGMNPRMLRTSLRSFLGNSKIEAEENASFKTAGARSEGERFKRAALPTIAGWFPTPISSPCFSRSLW